jgi:hypothetical protein
MDRPRALNKNKKYNSLEIHKQRTADSEKAKRVFLGLQEELGTAILMFKKIETAENYTSLPSIRLTEFQSTITKFYISHGDSVYGKTTYRDGKERYFHLVYRVPPYCDYGNEDLKILFLYISPDPKLLRNYEPY